MLLFDKRWTDKLNDRTGLTDCTQPMMSNIHMLYSIMAANFDCIHKERNHQCN
jgi:hypothetical protein